VLVRISGVLSDSELARCREALQHADWEDGRHSAGYLSAAVKHNSQLADSDPVARDAGEIILAALERNSKFTAAALPLKVLPPLFNRYRAGQSYGAHIDGAIRPVAGSAHRIRTDLSATLFLSDPDAYQGGELVIRDSFGERAVKLPAGDLILYPGTSVHRIEPVSEGERLAAFFWIQSMVRDLTQRAILYELDASIQALARDIPEHSALVGLAGVYHNLLRCWADS
jgi:PKHD-type hydroxylase